MDLKYRDESAYKTCKICGETKDINEFRFRQGMLYRDQFCKTCDNKARRSRRKEMADLVKKIETGDYKICPKCSKILPIEEFYLCTRSSDGHQYCCKYCAKEYKLIKRIQGERNYE